MLLALAIVACTGKPPDFGDGDQGTDRASPGDEYDPATDPLVNPASLLQPAPRETPEVIDSEATLTLLLPGSPNSLNSIFQSSGYEMRLVELLSDELFIYDKKLDWHLNDAMVDSYELSEDLVTATVKLKPGLKWHDGKAYTTEDIRFSWEVIRDERVPCVAVKNGMDDIADVQVVDERTVKFVHKEALPTSHWNLIFPVIPKHIFDKPGEREKDPTLKNSDYYNHYAREEIISNGPYRFVEWVTNDRIVLERWDGYPGKKPRFKRVIFKIQPDDNTSLLLFKKGQLDEMRLTSKQFATQTNDAQFKKVGVKGYNPEWSYAVIGWNMDGSNPFFSDRTVRRAMAHAFNYGYAIKNFGYSVPQRCYGIFHPDSWMFNPNVTLFSFDLKKAAQLLESVGWTLDPNDGLLYKTIAGAPVKFEFTLTIPQGSSTGPQVAAMFEQDLAKIGVSLKTASLEWATFQQRTRQHELQAFIMQWGSGAEPYTTRNIYHSENYAKGRNYGGYTNPRVDELYDLVRVEFDKEKRAEYYREIQKHIFDDQAYLYLWNNSTTWAFSKRIRGVQFSPRGVSLFDPSVRGWWAAKE